MPFSELCARVKSGPPRRRCSTATFAHLSINEGWRGGKLPI